MCDPELATFIPQVGRSPGVIVRGARSRDRLATDLAPNRKVPQNPCANQSLLPRHTPWLLGPTRSLPGSGHQFKQPQQNSFTKSLAHRNPIAVGQNHFQLARLIRRVVSRFNLDFYQSPTRRFNTRSFPRRSGPSMFAQVGLKTTQRQSPFSAKFYLGLTAIFIPPNQFPYFFAAPSNPSLLTSSRVHGHQVWPPELILSKTGLNKRILFSNRLLLGESLS